MSFDWNYYQGGRTTVAGVQRDNSQQNSRLGVTLSLPFKQHVVKVAFSDSLSVKAGGDYWSVLIGYSFVWM